MLISTVHVLNLMSPDVIPMPISTMHVLNLTSPDVRPMLIDISTMHVLTSITYKKQENTIWHMNA